MSNPGQHWTADLADRLARETRQPPPPPWVTQTLMLVAHIGGAFFIIWLIIHALGWLGALLFYAVYALFG